MADRHTTDEHEPIRDRTDGQIAGGGSATHTDDLRSTRQERPEKTGRSWPTILIVLALVALLLFWIF